MQLSRTARLIVLSCVCALATPGHAMAAEIYRTSGSSVEAGIVSSLDACVTTQAYVVAADAGSFLIDAAVGDSQIYMFVQRRDNCINEDSSYFARFGALEPGALTISPDRATASLTTSFDTYDYAAGRSIHVDVSLAWTNTGVRSSRADQRHHVHNKTMRLLERFEFDTWTANLTGSIRVDGAEVISTDVTTLIDGRIGADHTSRLVIERMALLAAAPTTAAPTQPAATSTDTTYGYAHWTGGDGACAASVAEVYVSETDQSAALGAPYAQLNLTVGRFDVCTGEYFEWISNGWELTTDDVRIERGGAALSLTKSLDAVSSVTSEPVTVSLVIRWAAPVGNNSSWDTFTSHELNRESRIHWAWTIRDATPTVEIVVGGSRFELGSLDVSHIVATSFWIKTNPQR